MPVSVKHNGRQEVPPTPPPSRPGNAMGPDLDVEHISARESHLAMLNVLEDFHQDRQFASQTNWAILNILEDFNSDKNLLTDTTKAVLNILEDLEEAKAKTEALNAELERRV